MALPQTVRAVWQHMMAQSLVVPRYEEHPCANRQYRCVWLLLIVHSMCAAHSAHSQLVHQSLFGPAPLFGPHVSAVRRPFPPYFQPFSSDTGLIDGSCILLCC